MSFRVLVIPEDPTYNGYILKPLVKRLMIKAGKPKAEVNVLPRSQWNGYDAVVAALKKGELAANYTHFDLWLFLPDADRGTPAKLDALERHMRGLPRRPPFLACGAQPEVEAWLLAGHQKRLAIKWKEVRAHPKLKEAVFGPFLLKWGDERAPGGGRGSLMDATLSNFSALLKSSPEIAGLLKRIRRVLGSRK
ncbi:MAG: hypothetical protein HY719_10410 [Planctomycetes bacterium]|nr:hypothetical protein [Planctomycetota bacterium]